ncbi:MAG: NAD-dependent epimerase/dehydratase family protein [Polyangia bacterium]
MSEQENSKGLVAVTGAAGHIGGNLVRGLLAQGRRVRALVREHTAGIDGLEVEVVRCDVTDAQACRRALAGASIVYHLAARISVGWDPPGPVEAVNLGGTRNVVEACLACGVERLIHFSSIHAFSADPTDSVIDESRPLVAADQPHLLVYDRTKAEGERQVVAAVARGLDAVVVNPSSVIGPYDFGPSAMGEVLLDLYHGRFPALVGGAGFNWVDVRDVVASALLAECRGRKGEHYLLTGHWLSLVELARLWGKVSGAKIPRLVAPMGLARAAAPFAAAWARLWGRRPLFTSDSLRVLRNHRHISHACANAELAHNPRPLEETLRDTFQWFRQAGKLA